MNSKISKLFLSFFIISFVLYSAYLFLIVKFTLLPIISFFVGLSIYLSFKNNGIYYLVFLIPFINSLPSLFNTGYPHNYLSVSLFLFSGAIIYHFLFESKSYQKIKKTTIESWEKYYAVFLIILFLSALFLFLRWSNITLSAKAFLKDTPVTPSGQRVSFGSIFPLLTLLQFSIIPLLYLFFKNKKSDKFKLFKYLSLGFSMSVFFAIIQKFVNDEFLVTRYGSHEITKQLKNGGFCDQNSFVFFSGIILFFSILFFYKNKKLSFAVALLSIAGGILSGAKVFYIFVLLSAILLFFILKASKKSKIIFIIVILTVLSLLIIVAGNTGNKRIKRSIIYLKNSFSAKNSNDRFFLLNHATNGRLEMIVNSLKILKKYPFEGVGTGNFLLYNEYQNLGKLHTHDLTLDEYLRILTETGIIGFIYFTLFILSLFKKMQKIELLIFIFILSIFFVGNYLWSPESLILFSLSIYLLSDKSENRKTRIHKSYIIFSLFALILFSIFNIKDFKELHPLTWSLKKGKDYDYGFWYEERNKKGETYKWTKDKAGIFVSDPKSFKVRLYCGAPLDKIPEHQQKITVFINGEKFKNIVFKSNISENISVKTEKPFFFEMKISPVFNLHKMGLGEERRELGIILYYKSKHNQIKSSITTIPEKLELYQGEKINIIFTIKNNSEEVISSENGYFFSYHLYNMKGGKIKFDNRRFPINKTIKPNETVSLTIPVYFDYPVAGKYIAEFDIVKEGFYWLSSLGWKTPKINLDLKPLVSKEFKQKHLGNFNIFEWEDKNNIGRGASFYTGAAGISGEIIFKYYGGFKENPNNYIISKKNNFLKTIINGDIIIINDRLKNVDAKTKN